MRPIKRIHPTSDETPPWAGMSFIQPVDSDALHELLKHQYPQCASLRQRKHMAAIDFLRRELESMQNETAGTSPGDQTRISPQTSLSAPEKLGERKHQRSISPSLSQSSSYRSPTLLKHHPQQSPAMKKMGTGQQHVFSIVDGLAMQPKKKRKMTPAERSAYKTTRKVGACDKCKRQKGKCTHVIETPMLVGKALRKDDITLQRPDAALPFITAARDAEDPASTRRDRQDLSQSNTAPGSPHWVQEIQGIQEGNRSEISGYVPSHLTGLCPRPMHDSQEIQWNNQSSFIEPQSFQSSYDGYMDTQDQSGDSCFHVPTWLL
ncbi:hypothetical protein G6011_01120 [Alternaria panax]|uniref:Uncharacterized protein n=1 Tax=Alternaria panax TaxID=48097 RepID=A0AAD4NVN1_9PLEO|nr:hypothetical protein G6011_01120 [Alternaria panax]